MGHPILFLDFDGVLNTDEFLESLPKTKIIHLPGVEALVENIDRVHVTRLNAITRSVNAEIVVSSTWRLGLTVRDLQVGLKRVGVEAPVIGATPVLSYDPRGREIHAWLRDNGRSGDPFVILDDVDEMGDLRPWLVKTHITTGLTDGHIPMAIRILRDGPP